MSKESDPLRLAGLDAEVIDEAVAKRSKKTETAESKERLEVNKKREERLQQKEAAGGGRSASAAAPAPPPPEPEKDRSKMLDKIGQYRERFPEVKSRNKIGVKSSVEEIEDELHYIEQQLGAKDSSMGMNLLVACMTGLEAANPLGLNLTGLSQVTKDNAHEFAPIIDELAIKYGASMYLSPEWRLCLALGSMVYTVHSANSGDPQLSAALDKMHRSAPKAASDL